MSKAPPSTASTQSWSAGVTAEAISMSPTLTSLSRTSPPSTTCVRCSVSEPLHVTFICSGNICRSPMAEKMFAHQLAKRGLSGAVRVTSAGTGGWHAGDAADHRASHVLREHGYPTAHCAAQIGDDHLSADLVVALGRNHQRMLQEMGVPSDRIRMLRSFDPRSGAHALDVEDPS